jgi:hypothetical protein
LTERAKPHPGAKVSFRDTFANFRDWCDENAEHDALRDYSSQRFHAEMDPHHPRSEKPSRGSYQRLGLRLIA